MNRAADALERAIERASTTMTLWFVLASAVFIVVNLIPWAAAGFPG